MKASDIYGTFQLGGATTQNETQPTRNESESKQSQAKASGKKIGHSYGTIAILAMFGILVGAKFALEKK